MPLVKCSGCGHEQIVPGAMTGLKVTCEACDATFTARPHRKATPTPWQWSAGDVGRTVIVTGGLAACVALMLFAFALLYDAKNKPQAAATPATTTAQAVKGEGRATGPRKAEPRPAVSTRPREPEPAARSGVVKAADEVASSTLLLLLVAGLALLSFAWLVAVTAAAVWIVRDCRNRSVDGGMMWGLLFWCAAVLGFVVGAGVVLFFYLATRPNGTLVPCEGCGNRRLSFVAVCPHCKRAVAQLDRTDPGAI